MDQKTTSKETIELLNALSLLAISTKKIAKDGLSVADLAHLVALAQQFETISKGIDGAKVIPAELKDLEQSEVLEIIAKLYSIANELNKA